MQENVTVELCDFPSSSSVNNHSSNNYLSIMLKTKLRESSEIAFSLKWEPIYEISETEISQCRLSNIYDIKVVPDRNLLIFGSSKQLYFLNLKTRTLKRVVPLRVKSIRHISIDEDYLYLTTGDKLMKYNLNSLLDESLEPEKALIWESPWYVLSNSWGLALHRMNSKKYVFVMDYDKGMFVFDSETGQQVAMQVPKINAGRGITFTDENEMIISTSDRSVGPVQIYIFENESQSWKLSREAVRTQVYCTPYGIYYERKTKLIYLVDTNGKKIFVFNKQTMELVHEWQVLQEWAKSNIFSITMDPKKGHLYLTITYHSIQVLK